MNTHKRLRPVSALLRLWNHQWPGLLLVGLVGLLTACGRSPAERLLADYRDALHTAAGVESEHTVEAVTLPLYPGHRDRSLELTAIRVGLFGMLDYRRCEMLHLISERNSILGRVMPISQRLIYEVNFIQQAQVCHKQLAAEQAPADADTSSDDTFLHRLDQVLARKREDLAAVFWNATLASPEFAKAHSLAVSPLIPSHDNGFNASLQALDYFVRLTTALTENAIAKLEIDSAILEGHYQVLQAEQYGGRLLTSLALVTPTLQHAADVMAALEAEAECPPPSAEPALEQAFSRYIEQIHQQGQAWLQRLEQLFQSQLAPPAMRAYYQHLLSRDHSEGLWRQFERQRLRHAEPCSPS